MRGRWSTAVNSGAINETFICRRDETARKEDAAGETAVRRRARRACRGEGRAPFIAARVNLARSLRPVLLNASRWNAHRFLRFFGILDRASPTAHFFRRTRVAGALPARASSPRVHASLRLPSTVPCAPAAIHACNELPAAAPTRSRDFVLGTRPVARRLPGRSVIDSHPIDSQLSEEFPRLVSCWQW